MLTPNEPDSPSSWVLPVEGDFATFSTTLYRVVFWQSARVVWDQILVNHDGEESIRASLARREIEPHSVARYPIVNAPKWGPVQVYQRVFSVHGDQEKAIAQRFDGEATRLVFPDHEKTRDDYIRTLVPDALATAEPISTQELLAFLAKHRHVGDVRQQVEAVVHDLVGLGATYIISFAKTLGRVIDERQQVPPSTGMAGELSQKTDVFAIAWSLLRDKPIDPASMDGEDWPSGELLLNAASTAYFDLTGESVNLDPELLAVLDGPARSPRAPVYDPAPGSLATPETVAARIAEWHEIYQHQKSSPGAPASLRDGDPWWDPGVFRRWYAVRLLFGKTDVLREELWVVSLPRLEATLPVPSGVLSVGSEIQSFASLRALSAPGTLLRSEVTTTSWRQNGDEVLNIKRRFGGSLEEYKTSYIDSL